MARFDSGQHCRYILHFSNAMQCNAMIHNIVFYLALIMLNTVWKNFDTYSKGWHMKSRLKHIAQLMVAMSLVTVGTANASTVYSQAVNFNDTGAYFADNPSWSVYDDFRLGANASVNSVKIWGTYWSDGVVPSPANFLVTFHTTENNWANPFYSNTIAASAIIDTGFDHNSLNGANILEITLDLGSNVLFNSGIDYWLGIQAINSLNNNFAWQNSFAANNRYYQNNSLRSNDADVAFELNNNNAVPEPSSVALLGFGLAGLAALRRRKVA